MPVNLEFWLKPQTALAKHQGRKLYVCSFCLGPCTLRMQLMDSATRMSLGSTEPTCSNCYQALLELRKERLLKPKKSFRIMPTKGHKKKVVNVNRYNLAHHEHMNRLNSVILNSGTPLRGYIR